MFPNRMTPLSLHHLKRTKLVIRLDFRPKNLQNHKADALSIELYQQLIKDLKDSCFSIACQHMEQTKIDNVFV